MAIQHVVTGLYKVCNTQDRNGGMNPERYGRPVSALLHHSKAQIDYSPTLNNPNLFVAPKTAGTPITLFDDLDAAWTFAEKFPGRKVYAAEVFGEIITPTKVLKMTDWNWEDQLVRFWEAVLAGADLTEFKTRNAPPHTVAVFGVVRLGAVVNRPLGEQADDSEDDLDS